MNLTGAVKELTQSYQGLTILTYNIKEKKARMNILQSANNRNLTMVSQRGGLIYTKATNMCVMERERCVCFHKKLFKGLHAQCVIFFDNGYLYSVPYQIFLSKMFNIIEDTYLDERGYLKLSELNQYII